MRLVGIVVAATLGWTTFAGAAGTAARSSTRSWRSVSSDAATGARRSGALAPEAADGARCRRSLQTDLA